MNGDSDTKDGKRKESWNSEKDPESNFVAPILQKTDSWVTRSKLLSPEFNNIEDEAELGKLMGDEGEKLLTLIDDIRKIDSLRKEELQIPQVFLAPIKLSIVADLNSRL